MNKTYHRSLKRSLDQGNDQIYFIHGDESVLVRESLSQIRNHALSSGYNGIETVYLDNDLDAIETLKTVSSPSLFEEKKLIDIRALIPLNASRSEKLLNFISSLKFSDDMAVISSPSCDFKTVSTKWFKELTKDTVVIKIPHISGIDFEEWVTSELKKQNQTLSDDALQLLLSFTEGNLEATYQEIKKFELILDPGEIDFNTVKRVLVEMCQYNVFEIRDILLMGDKKRTFQALRSMKKEGVPELLVLWALTEDARTLLSMKHQVNLNYIWASNKKILYSMLEKTSETQLLAYLRHGAKIDRIIKGIEHGNPWVELETLAATFLTVLRSGKMTSTVS